MEYTDDIFTDKIRVAISYLDKRNVLYTQFCNMLADYYNGMVQEEDLPRYPLYLWCWQNFAELYGSVLRNTYAQKLEDWEREEVERIFKLYIDGKPKTLDDLKKGVELLIKIMSLNRFDDVVRKVASDDASLDEI